MSGFYIEHRSEHAIRIDKALKAKKRHKEFNKEYSEAPNKSDVEGYDGPGNKDLLPPGNEEHYFNKEKTVYIPNNKEEQELKKIFKKKLQEEEQIKDLKKTTNVVRTKKQLENWKKNPKSGDIQGIDTEAPYLREIRLEVVKKASGNPEISFINRKTTRTAGDIAFGKRVKRGYVPVKGHKGDIRVFTKDRSQKEVDRTTFHELGHAFDHNVIKPLWLSNQSEINRNYYKDKTTGFSNIKKGLGVPKSKQDKEYERSYKRYKQVLKVTRDVNPYNVERAPIKFRMYREQENELFADWFSSFVTQKSRTKKNSTDFYRKFRSTYKPFFKELKKKEKEAIKKNLKNF